MKKEKAKKNPVRYDFSKPVRLTAYKPAGLDILFYSAILGILVAAILFLLFCRDGHFALVLTTGRTVLSIPLIVIASFFVTLLRELWMYPRKLLKKSVWTIEEMMKLTGKNRKDTEAVMTRVLESTFIVSEDCILKDEA